MTDIEYEKYLRLYECVCETAKILEFDSFNKVYFCGTRLKYGIPNCLLIVVDELPGNRFYDEMINEGGCTGGGYLLNKPGHAYPWMPAYRIYHFHYKVITKAVFDGLKNDWNRIADESWIYSGNMNFIPGIDITDMMLKYNNLRAFL